jgi:hypothetical protein
MIAAIFLLLLAIYLVCGLLFAIPFALMGVKKIDPHAANGTWGFRLLIIPGVISSRNPQGPFAACGSIF